MNLLELSNKLAELALEERLDSDVILRVPDGNFTVDFTLNHIEFDEVTHEIILSEATPD